ncbi:MAG: (d)CMP kinase [Desulfobacteraceae bacterium]|nr:MAG: (d)CMP kinase [Desulfobacteraceae bacterium]
MKAEHFLITIDGPAGAGKTTVSKMLAGRLGYRYIDTGALYRGVAFEAVRRGISSEDDNAIREMCRQLSFRFELVEKQLRLFSGERDITDKIRTPEITMMASAISARPVVREFLLGMQREIGREKQVVFEGRDMGTVVFPEAEVKFFLDASPHTRAIRRFHEMKGSSTQTLEQVENDIIRRDTNDSTRAVAPLKAAEDAVRIDTTDLTLDAVIEKMMQTITGRKQGRI